MPAVDVVIPCYNYGRYLPAAVAAALSQTDVDVRVLVIDDCSTDDSLAVAQWLTADPRVEVTHHPVNRGHIATYNEGLLEWATGDYVVLISADDLLAPGALARAVAVMEADQRVGMVYGRAPYFEHNDALPAMRTSTPSVRRSAGAAWIERRCRDGFNVISSPEVVVRRAVQQQVGGYRPQFPHAGDLEMWLRIAAVSDIAYIGGVPQAYYRVHAASMQRTRYSTSMVDLVQRRDVFDHFFSEHTGLPNAAALHDRARLALAREALIRACRAVERDNGSDADDLVALAESLSPRATATMVYRGVRWRRWLGSERLRRTRLYLPSAALRRGRATYQQARWRRRGE